MNLGAETSDEDADYDVEDAIHQAVQSLVKGIDAEVFVLAIKERLNASQNTHDALRDFFLKELADRVRKEAPFEDAPPEVETREPEAASIELHMRASVDPSRRFRVATTVFDQCLSRTSQKDRRETAVMLMTLTEKVFSSQLAAIHAAVPPPQDEKASK